MRYFRIDLRAVPDTPLIEAEAKRQGRVLGPQTVVYPSIAAETLQEAVDRAIASERAFLYREKVWLMDAKEIGGEEEYFRNYVVPGND